MMTSPPLYELAYTFEALTIESLCQLIGPLFQSVNLHNDNSSVANMSPEERPLHLKILGAVDNVFVCCQQESSIVVFKDLTLDGRLKGVWKIDAAHDLNEHGAEGKNGAHRGAESRTFSVKSGEGNL